MTTDSLRVAAPLRSVLAALVVVALLITLTVVPASAASRGCSVKDNVTGRTYSTLQAAVDGAKLKATLLVRGTCGGPVVIRKSVRIRGVSGGGWGVPRLQAAESPVLVIQRGVKVTVASLLIAEGKGVINRGNTTFNNVHVKGAGYEDVPPRGKGDRRGILNTGSLRLLGKSWVRRTSGVINTGLLTLGGTARLRSNVTPVCHPAVRNTGTLVMNGRSNIGANWCDGNSRGWGTPFLNKGRLVMNHRSSISDQEQSGGSPEAIGAVWNVGTMVMNDRSSIHHNSAGGGYNARGGTGGGVRNEGRLVMRERSSISHNTAFDGDTAGRGGGVYNVGTLVMRGSAAVHDNTAYGLAADWPGKGGGIFNGPGSTFSGVRCVPGTLANVYANTPDDCYIE